MASCNCTPAAAFAWIGALLINVAFGFLVGWGASTIWPVGLVSSFLYTIILFFFAFKLQKHENSNRVTSATENEGEEGRPELVIGGGGNHIEVAQNEDRGDGSLRILVTLLYGLFTIAVAVTGLIISFNIIRCDNYDHYNDTPYPYPNPEMNVSEFPKDVQDWYHQVEKGEYREATFASIPSEGILLFTGTSANDTSSYPHHLWKFPSANQRNTGAELVSEELYAIHSLVPANNEVCFLGSRNIHHSAVVACSDGTTVRTNEEDSSNAFDHPENLYYANDNTLWFTAWSTNYYYYPLAYSATIDTLQVTLQSNQTPSDTYPGTYPNDQCDWDFIIRYRSVISIFTSILPSFVASMVLWRKWGIPTMPLTSYFALTGFLVALVYSIRPATNNMDDVLMWWYSMTGALCFVYLSFKFLLNRVKNQAAFTWGINFFSIIFFGGMIWLFGVPGRFDGDWWRWVLISILVYVPLAIVGIITQQTFLVLLGACGYFIDVWRLSVCLADAVSRGSYNMNYRIPMQFLVFAIGGVLIALFAWFLSKHQKELQTSVNAWIGRSCFRIFVRAREVHEENGFPSNDITEASPINASNIIANRTDGADEAEQTVYSAVKM